MSSIAEARQLIPELCRQFYTNGWVSGTGGGMSIRVGDKHVVAPSGVQKERMEASDLFVLDAQGNVLENPVTRPAPYKAPKLSECYPLFQQAFTLRDAGAVMHSHSVNAVLATLLDGGSEFRVTNLEMIKGIQGHGYYDSLCIPIIENTARECELTASLREAILKYPNTQAVLVRRHGVYVWGKDWIQAKTQAECYDYLFEAAVRMRGLGIDASLPPAEARPAKKRKLEQSQRQAVVLDIEGTVLPISFVKETLFPYAAQHMQAFLAGNVDRPEVHASLRKLHSAAENDGEGKWGLPHSGSVTSYKPALQPILSYISRLMQNDRKLGPLKELQGMVWHSGMASGDLVPELFSDVVPAMQQWADSGAKVYIFSSGSRQAQTDMFAHTSYGDIRHLLSGFFDTSSGAKMEAAAYSEIALAIGMDAHQIHFFTDIAKEADAAQAAGWHASLVSRPGNAELAQPVQHPLLTSLAGVQLPTDVPHKAAKLQNGHSNGTLQNGHK